MTKRETQSWILTGVGLLIALFSIYGYFIEEMVTVWEFSFLLILSSVFIVAKTKLIESIINKYFKL